MIFLHSNYPAHRHRMNIELLQSFFPDSNIIGPGGMTPFPKGSFDLNLVNTMLMEEIDHRLHTLVVSNIEELQIAIKNVFIQINTPNFLCYFIDYFYTTFEMCVQNEGKYVII